MVEGNSYTLAIIIILGLVAIFLIYWFAIRNKSCNNKVQQYEGYENTTGDGEEDDNEGNVDDENNDVHENFEVRMNNKDRDKKRFSEAQNFP